MKKTKLVSLFAAMTLLVSLTYSCAKEDQSSTPADQKQMNLKSAYVDCQSNCITPGSGIYYEKTGYSTGTIGANSKRIDYTVYNTETDFVVILKYTRTPVNSGSSSTIKVTVNGSDQSKTLINKTSATYTFPLASGWQACDLMNFSIIETIFNTDKPISISGTYNLIGICISGCTESFSYATSDNKNVVFTFVSPVSLTGAVVKLTCPHITGYTATDGKVYSVNNEKNPTVLTWKGDITACTPVTFSLSFAPDCGQNNAGFANVWTDFTVNEDSKKDITFPTGTTEWPIIKYSCPK